MKWISVDEELPTSKELNFIKVFAYMKCIDDFILCFYDIHRDQFTTLNGKQYYYGVSHWCIPTKPTIK